MSTLNEPAFVDPQGRDIPAAEWFRLQLGEPEHPDARVLAVAKIEGFVVETTWFGAYNAASEPHLRTVWRTGIVDIALGDELPTRWSPDRETAHLTHEAAMREIHDAITTGGE